MTIDYTPEIREAAESTVRDYARAFGIEIATVLTLEDCYRIEINLGEYWSREYARHIYAIVRASRGPGLPQLAVPVDNTRMPDDLIAIDWFRLLNAGLVVRVQTLAKIIEAAKARWNAVQQ